MALCLLEGGARVADKGGHEFHLSPHHLESVDEWGVLGLSSLVAPEVLAESDLDNYKLALLAVEGARVRRRGVRYSSCVDEVGGGAVPRPEYGLLSLLG